MHKYLGPPSRSRALAGVFLYEFPQVSAPKGWKFRKGPKRPNNNLLGVPGALVTDSIIVIIIEV